MSEQQLVDLENSLQALRAEFKRTSVVFQELRDKRSKKEDRLAAFRAWHSAAIEFFNAHDRVIAVGARVNADKNSTWYTDRAETAANLLHTICEHYKAVKDRSEDFSISPTSFRPSMTAFANIQRIVKETHADIAKKYRGDFVGLDLPTYGFDRDESEKPREHVLEWRFFFLGIFIMLVAVGMAVWGFSLQDLSKDQRFILHWILPLASGFAAWSFAGSLSAKGKGWQGFAIAATGGFGVWLISNFVLFRE
jgi:hypothetical protein